MGITAGEGMGDEECRRRVGKDKGGGRGVGEEGVEEEVGWGGEGGGGRVRGGEMAQS